MTSNTALPDKAPNPNLSDVCRCLLLCPSHEQLAALVLDVSKAHRWIRIRPQDQGLLYFRHRSVFDIEFWGPCFWLLLEPPSWSTHPSDTPRHSTQIYVDDLLALLLRSSAPLLTAILVMPMSWRKAALSARVTWVLDGMVFRL